MSLPAALHQALAMSARMTASVPVEALFSTVHHPPPANAHPAANAADPGSRCDLLRPCVLLMTMRAYPYGGGECYLLESARWLLAAGINTLWVSFKDNAFRAFAETTLRTELDVPVVEVAAIDDEATARHAIDAIIHVVQPDFIHVQGEINRWLINTPCRIPKLIGYHFWHDFVDLADSGNINILRNIEKHRLSRHFCHAIKDTFCFPYLVSQFMVDVSRCLLPHYEPFIINSFGNFSVKQHNRPAVAGHVLQVNAAYFKGGDTYLAIAKAHPELTMIGYIPTDAEFTDLARRTQTSEAELLALGLKQEYIPCVDRLYTGASCVMIPTKVDETFSRVVVEAVERGLPVIASARGNIPYLLGESGIYPADDSEWATAITRLLADSHWYEQVSSRQREHLSRKLGNSKNHFMDYAKSLIANYATKYRVGLFCPWGDQGLGVHARIYADILIKQGVSVYIFSHQSYLSQDQSLKYQQDPAEWAGYHVYYSYNNRESVSTHELRQFILEHKLGKLIFIEVCWAVNWARIFGVDDLVETIVIPNLETVVRSELAHHARARKILYTTRISEQVFTQNGIVNGEFIGHGVGDRLRVAQLKAKNRAISAAPVLNFIHVAGYNLKRKNTLKILRIFSEAARFRKDIHLTCLVQDSSYLAELRGYQSNAHITLITSPLSHQDVLHHIEKAHISIQLSSHEGLGLGFYEALSKLTPVLTIDAPPHHEIIHHQRTGWLLPAAPFVLYDNPEACVDGYQFDEVSFYSFLLSITRNQVKIVNYWVVKHFNTFWTESQFAHSFMSAVFRRALPTTLNSADE